MKKDEAVNWLTNLIVDIGDTKYNGLWNYEQALKEIRELLKKDDWIPVTERLPEVGSIVLCYCKHRAWMVGRINVCKYCAADKYKDKPYFDYNMNGFPEVIAWMPLPEPYEEGGETE